MYIHIVLVVHRGFMRIYEELKCDTPAAHYPNCIPPVPDSEVQIPKKALS
jgi:hypothetical protein